MVEQLLRCTGLVARRGAGLQRGTHRAMDARVRRRRRMVGHAKGGDPDLAVHTSPASTGRYRHDVEQSLDLARLRPCLSRSAPGRPSRPVSAVIDAVEALRAEGLVQWYGVSNWSTERLARSSGCATWAADIRRFQPAFAAPDPRPGRWPRTSWPRTADAPCPTGTLGCIVRVLGPGQGVVRRRAGGGSRRITRRRTDGHEMSCGWSESRRLPAWPGGVGGTAGPRPPAAPRRGLFVAVRLDECLGAVWLSLSPGQRQRIQRSSWSWPETHTKPGPA